MPSGLLLPPGTAVCGPACYGRVGGEAAKLLACEADSDASRQNA